MSKTQDKARRAGSAAKHRTLNVVVGIGVALAILGLATLAVNLIFFSRVYDVAAWETDVTVPGGFFALSPTVVDQLSFFVAVPGGLFLLALCFIMTGQVLRGRVGTRETKGLQGGTVVSSNAILSARAQLAWIGVALAFWVALIIVPMLLALGGGWPSTVRELPQTYVWINLGMYGALAAAIAGVLLVSHVKKQTYLALVSADDARLREEPSGVWRWITFRWRFDLWLGGIGGALIGSCWLALVSGDIVLLLVTLVIGIALFVVAVWMARQYWRAGVPLGMAESFA
ncbi:hypothetical protein L1277_000050 [Okibacterium sp. HSC-33S16]|nr:hypothetical protein [Okibacterium sp. HSC-33S16]